MGLQKVIAPTDPKTAAKKHSTSPSVDLPGGTATLSEKFSPNSFASPKKKILPTSSKPRVGSRLSIDISQIEQGVSLLLRGLGVNLADRNFLETPERVARFYVEMFRKHEPNWEVFPERYCNMILLRRHEIWSLCPHHLLPVRLVVSIAYIPEKGRVLGLSKLARLVNHANDGPILQEEFTHRISECLTETIGCTSSAVYLVGEHMCARIRGVRTTGDFVTYSVSGDFETKPAVQQLFFNLVGGHNGQARSSV